MARLGIGHAHNEPAHKLHGADSRRFWDDRYVPTTPASESTPYRLEDRAGLATFRDKPIFTDEQVIAQLDSGMRIEGKMISFGFLETLPTTTGDVPVEYSRFSPFTEAQRTATREAMAMWDDLIAVHIIEKDADHANIVLANSSLDSPPGTGWAYMPADGENSSVWMASPGLTQYGGLGQNTLVHEIGHSLGLNHPGPYNNGADNDGDGVADPISYEGSATHAQDSGQFSVMTYFSTIETGGNQMFDIARVFPTSPQTPMLHDILTIQSIYGADPTTRCGNTTYFANSTAGAGVFDLAENPYPYLCVYDAGGNDTFDFSIANTGVFLDLRPGSFSSATRGIPTLGEVNAALAELGPLQMDQAFYEYWIDFTQTFGQAGLVEADTGVAGITSTMNRNISIAYNTVIENAIGGSARDYLVGNDVGNVLEGNDGDDVLNGLGGDDRLWGGAGADEFRFFDQCGNDTIRDFVSGTDTIDLTEIDADSRAAGDQAFCFVDGGVFSRTSGELRSYSSHGIYFVAGDVDGDGMADFTIGLGSAPIVPSDVIL